MSGIAAIFNSDGAPAEDRRLAAMLAAMDYRGEGGGSLWCDGAVALGHQKGRVLVSPDGALVLAFDGYLLNGDELRSELHARNCHLRDRSDGEIALQVLAVWGDGGVVRLEGEFAFIAWDNRTRRLLCARDHHGLRPLVYHHDGKRLVVASDIAAVLAALDDTPPLNLGYLAEHLANAWYTNDETAWQGVMKLPGAHWMVLDAGSGALRQEEYWSVPLEVTIRYPRDADYIEHYRELLDHIVLRAARSDRPVACEVSGGLDSSAVFCLLDRAAKGGRLLAPDLRGYSLVGPTGDHSHEEVYIHAVAAHTGRAIHTGELFRPELEWFHQQGAQDCTLPFPPNAAMMVGLHKRMAADGCGLCLTGHGGDQWLNGSPRHYRESLAAFDLGALVRSLGAEAQQSGATTALRSLLRHGIAPLAPEHLKRLARRVRPLPADPLERHDWLAPHLRDQLAQRRERYEARMEMAPPPVRGKLRKIKHPWSALVNEMIHLQGARRGIEYRHPMLSRRLIEFSARTPDHVRWRAGTRKFLHREAMHGILPEMVRTRAGKAYFDMTFQRLHPAMEAYCRSQFDSTPFSSMIATSQVNGLFARYGTAAIDDGAIWELWGLFSVATFCAHSQPRSSER